MNCQSIKQSLDSIIDSADETTKEKILTDLKQLSNDMKQTLELHKTSYSTLDMYDMLQRYHSTNDQRSISLESGLPHKMKSETIPTPFNSYNQEYKLVFNIESSPSFGSTIEINPCQSPVLSYHPSQSPKLSFMLQ